MKKKEAASMFGVWMLFGVAMGVATHQLALWLSIGVALGAAFTGIAHRRAKPDDAVNPEEKTK